MIGMLADLATTRCRRPETNLILVGDGGMLRPTSAGLSAAVHFLCSSAHERARASTAWPDDPRTAFSRRSDRRRKDRPMTTATAFKTLLGTYPHTRALKDGTVSVPGVDF